MHKDDASMLKYVCKRLKIGHVYVYDQFASFYVSSKEDLQKIYGIFDKSPLNTSKHLNYLDFKKAFHLYLLFLSRQIPVLNESKREGHKVDSSRLRKQILALKDSMNKKRTCYKQPVDHRIEITPYWLLGFVEAEGYFSVATSSHRLEFGIGQTLSELSVLEAIKKLLSLPGSFKITRKDTMSWH
jgi:hypothetical protein